MSRILIDLNDAELRVARDEQEITRSPGYATLVQHTVVVGEQGFAHAWLHPRHTHSHYWETLNTAPITQLGKRIRHAGDLAFLHLEYLREQAGRPDRITLIVPGRYTRTQLSLLLGIAEAAGLTVEGLVDSAVAVGATLPPGHYRHVEALLHHTVISHLEVNPTAAQRTDTEIIPGTGIADFETRILDCIVAGFLRDCRFDARHDALTEQALHTQLAGWLVSLADNPEIVLALNSAGIRHETRLSRDMVLAAIAPLTQRLVDCADIESPLLDYRLGRLPGIDAAWPGAIRLPASAALTGVTHSPDFAYPSTGGMTLRTTLAPASRGLCQELNAPAMPGRGATHLLVGDIAHPLSRRPLYLTAEGVQRLTAEKTLGAVVRDAAGCRVDPVPGTGLHLNGTPLAHQMALQPGDRLSFAGAKASLVIITVAPADAL